MRQKGHARTFDISGSKDDKWSAESEEHYTWASEDFLEGIEADELTALGNIISMDCHVDSPESGIMGWIENLYLRSRGIDLGSFSEAILLSAFKEHSSNWIPMAKSYVSHIIVVMHRFIITALNTLCTDVQVRGEIWTSILDEVLKKYQAAMDQAMFLVSLEREKRLYTINQYFNENFQIARGNRTADMLKARSRNDSGLNFQASSSDNSLVSLDDVRDAIKNQSNLEHAKEEIHDILWSYYKAARKR